MKIPKKKESCYIKGICVLCNINLQQSKGQIKNKTIYRSLCTSCSKKRHNMYALGFEYRKYKENCCSICNFIPIHSCQLDVDHIDGNHKNNNIDNLQTLCANCHRLKTVMNKDYYS